MGPNNRGGLTHPGRKNGTGFPGTIDPFINPEDSIIRRPVSLYDRNFTTKDSGKRQEFDSGMVRDTQDGKPRFDLIPIGPLARLANLYMRGAVKYDENNWQKGQPYSRAYASLLRHIYAWRAGEATEDHLAAVVWNAMALMYYEEKMPELDDLFKKETK
jgi:hypothetical protein